MGCTSGAPPEGLSQQAHQIPVFQPGPASGRARRERVSHSLQEIVPHVAERAILGMIAVASEQAERVGITYGIAVGETGHFAIAGFAAPRDPTGGRSREADDTTSIVSVAAMRPAVSSEESVARRTTVPRPRSATTL